MSTTIIDTQPRVAARTAAPPSAVSWGAVLAGAAGAAALSLVLLILGTGLGLAAVSPWSFEGVSATTFGVSTIIWITFTQLFASAVGGYLAGRLRAKWADTAGDEVYFRDTAHGFLAWCVASLGTAAVLTSVVGAIASGGVQAGAAAAGQVASSATTAGSSALIAASDHGRANGEGAPSSGGTGDPFGYFVDSLFRSKGAGASAASEAGTPSRSEQSAANTAEVTRIFANAIRTGTLPDEDARYVGRSIAERTDLSAAEAEQRVRDTFMRLQTTLRETEDSVRKAADEARKASAYAALWLVVSLLVGAFVASLMATFGGRQRDL